MNRVVAMVPAAQAAAKEVQATPRTEMNPRRVTAAAAGAFAGAGVGGFAAGAAGGAGGPGVVLFEA